MPCSQNRDLKCNRICKLPASSPCLGAFLWSLFFFFKLPIFTLSSRNSYFISSKTTVYWWQCDLPGSGVKCCSYSLMVMDSYKILHVMTVDKRKVNFQTPNMKHEAFVCSKNYIKEKVTCSELVTDANTLICT